MGFVAPVASYIGTAMTVASTLSQASAASASAKYNAQVQANNAKIAQQNATWARQAGEQQVAIEQQKTRAAVGGIKAQQAASGIDINQGSAVDVRSSAAELGQLSALTVRSEAARKAYGYDIDAYGFNAQSKLSRAEAKSAKTAGYIEAASTALSGGGSAYKQYKDSQSLRLYED